MFKKFSATLSKITALICLPLCFCTQTPTDGTLKVGTSPDYPNYEFRQNGEITGFEIDLVREIGRRLNKKVELVERPFDTLIPELHSGSIDMIASGISPTPKRRENLDFSTTFYSDKYCLISNDEMREISTLMKKKVGTQSGSIMEQIAKLFATSIDITIHSVASNNMLIEELKQGRLDAVILARGVANTFVQKNPNLHVIPVDDLEMHKELRDELQKMEEEKGTAFAYKKDCSKELREKIDEILEQLIKEGFVDGLANKWHMG